MSESEHKWECRWVEVCLQLKDRDHNRQSCPLLHLHPLPRHPSSTVPMPSCSATHRALLRFGLARLATETQDVRMPVQFECPHCEKLIEQTKKNRSLPTIDCPDCKQTFSTQWAETEADKSHRRGPVVSERFEIFANGVQGLQRTLYGPGDLALQVVLIWQEGMES